MIRGALILVAVLAVVAALAGCGPTGDPLLIHYTFTSGTEQACSDVTDCNDLPMTCDSVALLRVVDANNPETVYINQCVDIPNMSGQHNLCPIAQAPFDLSNPMPTTRVEVQLAIYPRSALIDDTGAVVCPAAVNFTATGFARGFPDNLIVPALAGRAFADGYDKEVTVELGCNDISLIDNRECRNLNTIDVTASVIEFDTSLSVDNDTATDLNVRVGEPKQQDLQWVLGVASTKELPLVEPPGPEPSWAANDLDIAFLSNACIQVLSPQAIPSLTCRPVVPPLPPALDLTGVLVAGDTLTQVLTALGEPSFPPAGLVLGIVVDDIGTPVAGVNVVPDNATPPGTATVQYLSADRMSTLGLTHTTTSGIFMSLDSAFDNFGSPNRWHTAGTTMIQRTVPVGGLVENRLTVLVIQLDPPT